jgi:hypothetical protein
MAQAKVHKPYTLTEELVCGAQQKNFVPQQHIIWVYKVHEKFMEEMSTHFKQFTLHKKFKRSITQPQLPSFSTYISTAATTSANPDRTQNPENPEIRHATSPELAR